MFGNKKKDTSSPRKKGLISNGASHQLNSIVKGSVIEGKISSDSDIRVDGVINGTLNCAAKVIIGPTGKINGDVNCQNAVFEGQFEGVLKVEEMLIVKEKAIITGDITTNKLVVQAGAIFNVSCTMGANKPGHSELSKKSTGRKINRNGHATAETEKGYHQKEAS